MMTALVLSDIMIEFSAELVIFHLLHYSVVLFCSVLPFIASPLVCTWVVCLSFVVATNINTDG